MGGGVGRVESATSIVHSRACHCTLPPSLRVRSEYVCICRHGGGCDSVANSKRNTATQSSPSIFSGGALQVNLWRFFVCFVHTWTNNLIPGTETEASLQKYPELRHLVKFLRVNNLKIGQCKKQLRLLKDQTLPQAGVSVDVTADPSGKLADLMDQVGQDAGCKVIAEDAVRALLAAPVCKSAKFYRHMARLVEAVRPELMVYATGLVKDLVNMVASHRAGKATMKTKRLEEFMQSGARYEESSLRTFPVAFRRSLSQDVYPPVMRLRQCLKKLTRCLPA